MGAFVIVVFLIDTFQLICTISKDIETHEQGLLTALGIIVGIIVGIVSIVYYAIEIRRKAEKKDSDQKKKRYSMRSVRKAVTKIVSQINNDKYVPSIIFGIGRGGGIFGSFISYKLYHCPLIVIDRDYDWITGDRIDKILFDFEIPANMMDKILMVAGESHSGRTIQLFKDYLYKTGAGEIKTCVFYKQLVSTVAIDYFGMEGDGVPLMPWQDKNYIRDSISKKNSEDLQRWRQEILKFEGKTFYIIRHGETDDNKNDIFIGVTNSELNINGKQQINKLSKYLFDIETLRPNDTVILSSNQNRCVETSEIIKAVTGITVTEDKHLRERNYGQWEGLTRQDVKSQFKAEYDQYRKNPLLSCPPNSDSLTTIIGNIYQLLNTIEKIAERNIIIVTHKTTGRLLLAYLTHTLYSKYRDIEFENGSVSKFQFNQGRVIEYYVNKHDF